MNIKRGLESKIYKEVKGGGGGREEKRGTELLMYKFHSKTCRCTKVP